MNLIISRTPMRISFVGGATDIEDYYGKFGGEVVTCAINRYIYVTLNHRDDKKIVVNYTKTEIVNNVDEIEHGIVREALKMAGITNGIEIHIIANISTIGTGLGGSSAVAVGLLRVLFPDKSQIELAAMACELEINRLGKHIGKQDQYACALGKVNHIYFSSTGFVAPVRLEKHSVLTNKMYLVKVPVERYLPAEKILEAQKDCYQRLHVIKTLCMPFMKALKNNDNLELSKILNTYWRIKRQLSDQVSNQTIEALIAKYRHKGCGAKLCGAGQSGFIFVFDPSSQCDGIPVEIDYQGTIISYI